MQGDDNTPVRYGYGRLKWPDNSSLDGWWVNGQGVGIGLFRSASGEEFQGGWQVDHSQGVVGAMTFKQIG